MSSGLRRFTKVLRLNRHKEGQDDSRAPSTDPVGTTQASNSHVSIAEQLWLTGYQRLNQANPKLVDSFEAILSKRGQTGSVTSQDVQFLIQELTEKATMSNGIENLNYVLKIKDVVSSGLKTSPEAALAWSAVCVVIEILINTAHETVANRDGLQYVIQRLRFNNELSESRLAPDTAFNDLQTEVRESIVTLYQKILHYLLQSVVYLQQGKATIWMKDAIKLYDWEKLLQQVKDAETAATADYDAYKIEKHTASLQTLAQIARTTQDNECLRQLRITDPRDDKKRIEENKGGLLKDAYTWILDNEEFVLWKSQTIKDSDSLLNSYQKPKNLLWIRGDPGKGKTMLLCGIIDELRKENKQMAFFFCQATDTRINSAESVMRGLLYMLADEDQTSEVLSYIRKKSDHSDGSLFKDINAWFVLEEVFTKITNDLVNKQIWLVVDALDECLDVHGRKRLLDLIKNSPSNIKWLVSSRNWPDIEQQLGHDEANRLSLELNAESVTAAVNKYIDIKTEQLANAKHLKNSTANLIREYLRANASGTFLWVALVCQSLFQRAKSWNILSLLETFIPGLNSVYERINSQIDETDEAELTKQILAMVAIAYRPLSLVELGCLLPEPIDNEHLVYIIKQSGFLASQSSLVTFVHLSAKDFIVGPSSFLTNGTIRTHLLLWRRSMEIMSTGLHRNPYFVTKISCRVSELEKPVIDPLASIAYSCLYWPQHLLEIWKASLDEQTNSDNGEVLRHFLQQSYLYWIEALMWMRSLSYGIYAMIELEEILDGHLEILSQDIKALYRDGLRFILSSTEIQEYPLQLYASALFFSPSSSLIRNLFKFEIPSWLKAKHQLPVNWSRNPASFLVYNARKLVLSPDGRKLAILTDTSVQIRNAITSASELNIDFERNWGCDISFTGNGLQIVILGYCGQVCRYDCTSGKLLKEVPMDEMARYTSYNSRYTHMAYGLGDTRLVHSHNGRLNCRDSAWNLLHTHVFEDFILKLKISPDNSRLIVGTRNNAAYLSIIHLCITDSGEVLWMKKIQDDDVWRKTLSFTFTPDGSKIVSLDTESICYWNIEMGTEESKIAESRRPDSLWVCAGDLLYTCRNGSIIRLGQSGEQSCINVQEDDYISTLAINQKWFLTLTDCCVRFYSLDEALSPRTSVDDSPIFLEYRFTTSPNWKYCATVLRSGMIRLWRETLESEDIISPQDGFLLDKDSILSLSNDGRLAATNRRGHFVLWDIATMPKLLTSFIIPNEPRFSEIVFSPKGPCALLSYDFSHIFIYDDSRVKTLSEHGYNTYTATFSSQGYLAKVGRKFGDESRNEPYALWNIEIWNIDDEGSIIQSYNTLSYGPMSFSHDGNLFAHAFRDRAAQETIIQIKETKTWQVVEIIKFDAGIDFEYLMYSQDMGCFRTEKKLLYPKEDCTEVFCDHRWVSVGNQPILLLPTEYYFGIFKIHGNSIIHGLNSGYVSLLEIDAEEATKSEAERETVRKRAISAI